MKNASNNRFKPSEDRERIAKQQERVNTKSKATAEQHEVDLARLQRLIDKKADLRKN